MISKDHVSTITIPHIRPNPILIENISPAVDGGRYPVKREVGDQFVVT
ncbi:MAG: maltotransferase domain-containing protein, partial [Thermomicrobiales bacterium]